MTISPARLAAFDILLRIERDKAFSSVLLPKHEETLSSADRSLCHELTLGTLRRQIYLDRIIDGFSGGKKLDIEVRIALRIGLYQLKFLTKIPPYSAINESVNLVQRAGKTSAKGLVNAILRRASRTEIELSYINEVERLSVETSHPMWLVEKWINDLGFEDASLLAAANNEIPATAFRLIGEPNSDARDLVEASRKSNHVTSCYIAEKPGHRLFELAEKGRIYIQDEASQLAAQMVELPDRGRFLDVCAAPGGKAALIAGRSLSSGASITAGDFHWTRIAFMRENFRRQSVEAEIVQYNAERDLPFEEAIFDSVLVDAPCSGTGTIRRNPEIRYFLRGEDFGALSAKQLLIVSNASKLVKLGGSLIYSTCSIEPEENEAVCGEFLRANADWRSVQLKVADGFITDKGFARTWPQRDGMDGFFIAAFRRGQRSLG